MTTCYICITLFTYLLLIIDLTAAVTITQYYLHRGICFYLFSLTATWQLTMSLRQYFRNNNNIKNYVTNGFTLQRKKNPQLTYLCLPQISYANDSRSRQPEIYTFVGRTHIYTGLKSVLPSERIGRQARVGRKHGQGFARTCRTVMKRSADCRSSRRPATRWECRTVFFFCSVVFRKLLYYGSCGFCVNTHVEMCVWDGTNVCFRASWPVCLHFFKTVVPDVRL